MSSTGGHERETDNTDEQRLAKRAKVDGNQVTVIQGSIQDVEMTPTKSEPQFSWEDLLPPSRSLLPVRELETGKSRAFRVSEPDVGISEYIAFDVPPIEGIIKQRFTDFIVYEVDLQSEVVHLKSITEPELPKTSDSTEPDESQPSKLVVSASGDAFKPLGNTKSHPVDMQLESEAAEAPPEAAMGADDPDPWPSSFTDALAPLLSSTAIEQLKEMLLQGPEPPFVSNDGWGSQQSLAGGDAPEGGAIAQPVVEAQNNRPLAEISRERRGKDKGGRGRGRSVRGVRSSRREDLRRVLSDPILSKQERTAFHEVIRTLFKGKLETETEETGKEGGQRIIMKWSKTKGGNVKRGSKDDAIARGGRGNPFPYIHFSMQKTNRDTQDALAHLSRLLHVNVKDLSVSGTKDKRGVTIQRVSFKRHGKKIQDVWKTVNGVSGRRTVQQAITERGERGVRIGDLAYRKGYLELGMLKGNAFIITLRNVKVNSMETVDRALESLREHGFINYYGMQRFGTASIPTHSIGLALLRSDWTGAVSLIMRPRPGEYPEADAARRAWLEEKDLDKALSLMPRRVVAERCILESYKKQGGDDRNALGAISTIPKNLRLMYIHAYQSYVWNAIVSERIKKYGRKPIVGDLVFDSTDSIMDDTEEAASGLPNTSLEADIPITVDDDGDENVNARSGKRERKAWQPPRIKVLGADDLDKYTIFDIIMPLPGTEVAYPEGPLGEQYRAFLRLDGLDPDNFNRKQRDYTLGGSYRKILHLPKHLSWCTMRYTDPDVALAQSDEDQLLGFDPPATDENGPFLALQIRLQLGTAAYATMALREVTKTETSAHHQSALTQASDDQMFKGIGDSFSV